MKSLLLYVADPMCSWCWGFSPVFGHVRERFADRFDTALLMGGLAAGNREPLDASTRESIREHWEHVFEASGQAFDFGFFDREAFVYDTEPACRAVVCARELEPGAEFGMLEGVHRAFYAENRDVTNATVLADVAAAEGLDRAAFSEALEDPKMHLATGNDFSVVRTAGIQGFPALLAGAEERGFTAVTVGYQPYEAIEALLERWLADA